MLIADECMECSHPFCREDACWVYRWYYCGVSNDGGEKVEVEYDGPVIEYDVGHGPVKAFIDVEDKPRLKLSSDGMLALPAPSNAVKRSCTTCGSEMTSKLSFYYNQKPVTQWTCTNHKCFNKYLEGM